jgi:hypothetical protein
MNVERRAWKKLPPHWTHRRLVVPHHPRRATDCRQVFLSGSTTSRLLIPRIHHAIPFSILTLVHDRTSIHRTEQHSPLAATRIAASNPLIWLLCMNGSTSLLSLTILICLVTMETTHPQPEMFACALIHGTFGCGCDIVLFFRSTASGSFWIVLVHGAVPFGGKFACINDSA